MGLCTESRSSNGVQSHTYDFEVGNIDVGSFVYSLVTPCFTGDAVHLIEKETSEGFTGCCKDDVRIT